MSSTWRRWSSRSSSGPLLEKTLRQSLFMAHGDWCLLAFRPLSLARLLIGAAVLARPTGPDRAPAPPRGHGVYEWLRGPRLREELAAKEALFPRESAVSFGAAEAALAADLYRSVRRPRGRELDLAVAACALAHSAALWTLNPDDFRDIPELSLFVSG